MRNPTVIFVRSGHFRRREFPLGWTGVEWVDPQSSPQELEAIFLADDQPVPELTHSNRSRTELLLIVEHAGCPIDESKRVALSSMGVPRGVMKFHHEDNDPTFTALKKVLLEDSPGDAIRNMLDALNEATLLRFYTECAASLEIMVLTGVKDTLCVDAPPSCVNDLKKWSDDLSDPNESPLSVLNMVIRRAESLVG